jgi:hypothetical protein
MTQPLEQPENVRITGVIPEELRTPVTKDQALAIARGNLRPKDPAVTRRLAIDLCKEKGWA